MIDSITFRIPLGSPLPTLEGSTAGGWRADRSEILRVLSGALGILAADKSKVGAAYRGQLVARMRSIVDREERAR